MVHRGVFGGDLLENGWLIWDEGKKGDRNKENKYT